MSNSFSIEGAKKAKDGSEYRCQEDRYYSFGTKKYKAELVLDGHTSGKRTDKRPTAGQQVVARVPTEISKRLALFEQKDKVKLIKQIFKEVDAGLKDDNGGCVLSGYVLDDRSLTLFNLGDCEYILFGVNDDKWTELRRSSIHTPSSMQECLRMLKVLLQKRGVSEPSQCTLTSAMYAIMSAMFGKGEEKLPSPGEPYADSVRELWANIDFVDRECRLKADDGTTLAVSRALGDAKFKKGRSVLLSNEPDVVQIPYSRLGSNVVIEDASFDCLVVVLFSDGVICNRGATTRTAMRDLLIRGKGPEDILANGSRDDATVSISTLAFV